MANNLYATFTKKETSINSSNLVETSNTNIISKLSNVDNEQFNLSDSQLTNKNENKDWSIDDNFVYYNQNHMPNSNDTWDDYKYSNGGSNTMSDSGCAPTCMAMVMSSLGYDVTPNDTAEWSAAHGGHVSEGTKWDFFPNYASEMGISCSVFGGHSTDNITNSLEDGKLVIISAERGDFTRSGHFIVARGYNPDTNEILIADPNNEDNNQWWDADRIARQTAQCWAFD